jgi:hypothetical protein
MGRPPVRLTPYASERRATRYQTCVAPSESLATMGAMALRVFAFLLKPPTNACEAARVVVATDSANEAARILRRAGWHSVRWQAASASDDDDERGVAFGQPGVAWWYPWTQEPPRTWTRAEQVAHTNTSG